MLLWNKPTPELVHRFLERQAEHGFTYEAVGATAETPPRGYAVDHTRVKLGVGEAAFRAAQAALVRWEHFRLGWVEALPGDTEIRPGAEVAVLGRALGLWWLNACRIVYVVDQPPPYRKFGFAYGTLPDHAERGEERFQIEFDPDDQEVWYDILAFSRPNQLLTRLGYPLVRRVQKRFARDSAAAMERAVARAMKS
jgi:uncharacterized protein (UPF0548 family)